MNKRPSYKEQLEAIQTKKLLSSLLATNDAEEILKEAFEEQRQFILDPAQLKYALCTRRAGKTRPCALYLIREALINPGVNCIYVAPLRSQAEAIMLSINGFIPEILDKHHIEAKINHTKLTVTFPNKSVIYIMGMDTSPHQSKGLLGLKIKLAVFDECGSFRQDLQDMIFRLRPAMVDQHGTGTIAMIGTPENYRNFFYRVSEPSLDAMTGKVPGWSPHSWSFTKNPFTRDEYQKQLDDIIALYPGVLTNSKHQLYPMVLQHYFAKWVIDRNAKTYAFDEATNVISELPKGTWTYAFGIDLGTVDAATIVVVAYRDFDPTLYVTDVFSEAGLDNDAFAMKIVEYENRYKPIKMISDHDPGFLRSVAARYEIYIQPADKTSKVPYIEMMNAEWLRGKIKIVRKPFDFTINESVHQPNVDTLIEELETLVWDKKLLEKGAKKEDPKLPNHTTDACLYIWRHMYHFLERPLSDQVKDPLEEYSRKLKRHVDQKIQQKISRSNPYKLPV